MEAQIKDMLDKGIIEESSSPWMAPAVYRTKKTGEVRICVYYRVLNKQTVKDAYPLPLVDEVQEIAYRDAQYSLYIGLTVRLLATSSTSR